MFVVLEKIIRYAVSLVFAGLTVFLGYFAQRTDFVPFITAYGVFFGLYVWLIFFRKKTSPAETRWYVGLGIALRVLLLFSIPNFSDDFYRFLWDGHLTVAGIHPFAHPPDYFIENQIFPRGITPELFSKLNSPEYFTVYPPVCQAVFALAAWVSPTSEWGGILMMKLFLLGCEIGVMRLLFARFNPTPSPSPNGRRVVAYRDGTSHTPLPLGEGLGVGLKRAGIAYALNPLLVLEIVGNCHFEGAMIFFLLAGLRALEQNEVKLAAAWWALATACKLLPLMFLPIVWRWLGWRKGLVFNVVFAGVCFILFAPLLRVLPNILSSLDLYFRQFQFNASFYYLFREVGFRQKGWDVGETIGPMLGAATVAGVLVIAWFNPISSPSPNGRGVVAYCDGMSHNPLPLGEGLGLGLLLALFLQLSLSATVHPWYVTVPFALGLGTKWRFPLVWSSVVALSYSHYAGGFFKENYGLILLEYAVLWAFIFWELATRRKSASSTLT